MIPIFKSHYSIGRSILTIAPSKDPLGADSVIDICKANNFDRLVLVEDSLTGFMASVKACKKADIQLIFGLRISCVNDIKEEGNDSEHKVVLFAKNDDGCRLLNKIYSLANTTGDSRVDFTMLNKLWTDDLQLVIPFYDSFLFKNTMKLGCCAPDFSKITPQFFIERNGLPFDSMVEELVHAFCLDKYDTTVVKSIFYNNRSDYDVLQTYKILCNRSFGKVKTLNAPNIEHFGSREFCTESFLEYERKLATV